MVHFSALFCSFSMIYLIYPLMFSSWLIFCFTVHGIFCVFSESYFTLSRSFLMNNIVTSLMFYARCVDGGNYRQGNPNMWGKWSGRKSHCRESSSSHYCIRKKCQPKYFYLQPLKSDQMPWLHVKKNTKIIHGLHEIVFSCPWVIIFWPLNPRRRPGWYGGCFTSDDFEWNV